MMFMVTFVFKDGRGVLLASVLQQFLFNNTLYLLRLCITVWHNLELRNHTIVFDFELIHVELSLLTRCALCVR